MPGFQSQQPRIYVEWSVSASYDVYAVRLICRALHCPPQGLETPLIQ